jgi:hypothetical protein
MMIHMSSSICDARRLGNIHELNANVGEGPDWGCNLKYSTDSILV